MPLERTLAKPVPTIAGPWRTALIRIAGTWLALILAFLPDWLAMAGQWWNSSTYNHILLVPAILVWLVWMRRDAVAQLAPQGWWPGLVLLTGATLVWVLGAFSGFDLLRQAGAVAVLPASLAALLGPRVFAGLLFPLCYMVFLVPFGDELVPPLQTVTAVLTVALVKVSAIPAVIDGVFIDTPAGLFEVAEACSGVKFLIAMIALGALVGNVCFKSWPRRIGFMALCVVVPILANAVRAWGTIYVAQYIGVERAGGFDHIVYGWLFFAVVIAACLSLGWRFFDRAIDDPMIDATQIEASPLLGRLAQARLNEVAAILLCGAVVLGGQVWARSASEIVAPVPAQIFLPEMPGWRRVDYAPTAPWSPRANGADHRLLGRYADGEGRTVDVFVALYAAQGDGREAAGFGEGALPPEAGWDWIGQGAPVEGARSDRLRAAGPVERLALTYYRNGDLLTGSGARLKLATIADRLLLRGRPTTMLILSAESPTHPQAVAALDRFRQSAGPVAPWIDRIVQGR